MLSIPKIVRCLGGTACLASGRFRLCALPMFLAAACAGKEFSKPYHPPCTAREDVFEFTEKPKVKALGNDKYEIAFAVKGACDVTVGLFDDQGVVVRHLASGVLGANAPAPFQKNSLRQTIYWNGKDDLDAYVKSPGKLKVRVMLGLKPEFDKRIGVTNPKSIPGAPWGICCDETGVYLFFNAFAGWGVVDCRVRKFDHDGRYVQTLVPPPAHTPDENLQGLGFIEYESGRKALQTSDMSSTEANDMAGCLPHNVNLVTACRPAVAGGRIYYSASRHQGGISYLHHIRTDGVFEAKGIKGKVFLPFYHNFPVLAASPDCRWLYMGDLGNKPKGTSGAHEKRHGVLRCSLEDDKPGSVFLGDCRIPGSDNSHFNVVTGIDCDAEGRIYVCDHDNSRIQVFAADGKHQKTIRIDRPVQIAVHRKTGAIYVMHTTRVEGTSVNRISKLTSYDKPEIEFHCVSSTGQMMLDPWTARPRLWIYDENVRILEENGSQFQQIADFGEEVKPEVEKFGGKHPWHWKGSTRNRKGNVVCDPAQEQVWAMNEQVFDLQTGQLLMQPELPAVTDDFAFDKRGYLHCHLNPGFSIPAVVRLDPNRKGTWEETKNRTPFFEVPYDYGVEKTGPWKARWLGALPVRDQPGAKFFQDGIGVNMCGDVAEICNIYFVPKMEEESEAFAMQGIKAITAAGQANGDGESFETQNRFVLEMQRRGELVYSIPRRPGVSLMGGTIWTFSRNGEVQDECAVNAGHLINGVMIDENAGLYFVNSRTRLINGEPFLTGQCGVFGADPSAAKAPWAFTGTLIKTGRKATILSLKAAVPLDENPKRPPDFPGAWCEGAEWLYAGASAIVRGGCSCPTMRIHTDWYKRTFVPEKYRHSIGVVDTAGNLMLHIGQYGNFDSGYGPSSKIPVGGDGIGISDVRFVSGTDNYLCYLDRGERFMVLKLNYHAEEWVSITAQ